MPRNTPVIVRENELVDIKMIGEVLRVQEKGANVQRFETPGLEVWDGEAFVRVLGGTAYRHRPVVDNKGVARIEARCGTVTTTADHVVFMADGERPARTVESGDRMQRADLPERAVVHVMLARYGVDARDVRRRRIRLRAMRSVSRAVHQLRSALARNLRGRVEARHVRRNARYTPTTSGFVPGKIVGALALNGAPTFVEWLRGRMLHRERAQARAARRAQRRRSGVARISVRLQPDRRAQGGQRNVQLQELQDELAGARDGALVDGEARARSRSRAQRRRRASPNGPGRSTRSTFARRNRRETKARTCAATSPR